MDKDLHYFSLISRKATYSRFLADIKEYSEESYVKTEKSSIAIIDIIVQLLIDNIELQIDLMDKQ